MNACYCNTSLDHSPSLLALVFSILLFMLQCFNAYFFNRVISLHKYLTPCSLHREPPSQPSTTMQDPLDDGKAKGRKDTLTRESKDSWAEASCVVKFAVNQRELTQSLQQLSPMFEVNLLLNPNSSGRQISTRMNPEKYRTLADTFEQLCFASFGEDFPIVRREPSKSDIIGAFEVTLTIGDSVQVCLYSKVRSGKFPTAKLLLSRLSLALGATTNPYRIPTTSWVPPTPCFVVYLLVVDICTGMPLPLQRGDSRTEEGESSTAVKVVVHDDIAEVPLEFVKDTPTECCCSVQAGQSVRIRCIATGWRQLFPQPSTSLNLCAHGCRVVRVYVGRCGKLQVQTEGMVKSKPPSTVVVVKETGQFKMGMLEVSSESKTNRNGSTEVPVCLNTTVSANYIETKEYFETTPESLDTTPSLMTTDAVSYTMRSWLALEDKEQERCTPRYSFRIKLPRLLPRKRWCRIRFADVSSLKQCVCSRGIKGLPLVVRSRDNNEEVKLWCSCSCSSDLSSHQLIRDIALSPGTPVQIRIGSTWNNARLVGRANDKEVLVNYESTTSCSQSNPGCTRINVAYVRPPPVQSSNSVLQRVIAAVNLRKRLVYPKSTRSVTLYVTYEQRLDKVFKSGDYVVVGGGSPAGKVTQVLSNKSCLVLGGGLRMNLPHDTYVASSEAQLSANSPRVNCVVAGIVFPSFGEADNGSCGPHLAYLALPLALAPAVEACKWIPDLTGPDLCQSVSCCLLSLEAYDRCTKSLRLQPIRRSIPGDVYEMLPFPPGETRLYGAMNGSYTVAVRLNSQDIHCGEMEVSENDTATSVTIPAVPVNVAEAAAGFREVRNKEYLAACAIQIAWNKKKHEERSVRLSRLLQKSVRDFLTRRQSEKNNAAQNIQRLWRGHSGRDTVRQIRSKVENEVALAAKALNVALDEEELHASNRMKTRKKKRMKKKRRKHQKKSMKDAAIPYEEQPLQQSNTLTSWQGEVVDDYSDEDFDFDPVEEKAAQFTKPISGLMQSASASDHVSTVQETQEQRSSQIFSSADLTSLASQCTRKGQHTGNRTRNRGVKTYDNSESTPQTSLAYAPRLV